MTEERKKVALITGITGQDGSYLAELLLEKGYDVSFCRVLSRVASNTMVMAICLMTKLLMRPMWIGLSFGFSLL